MGTLLDGDGLSRMPRDDEGVRKGWGTAEGPTANVAINLLSLCILFAAERDADAPRVE